MLKKKKRENLDEYFESPRPAVKINKRKIIMTAAIIVAALVLLLSVWGIISLINNRSSQDAAIVRKVAKHLLIPEEQPTIVRIEDPENLVGEQPFYQGAEDGDYLLIFTGARKAVIYSRKHDIIINAGPIYAGQELEGLK